MNKIFQKATISQIWSGFVDCPGRHGSIFVVDALTHYYTMPHIDAQKIYSCGKHCEKRRNCL